MIPLAFTLIVIGFANVIRTQWILPHGKDRVLIASVVTGAVVNLLFNSLLIPRLGAMGAVIGTLLAETAVPVVQWLQIRREISYRPLLRPIVSYVVMGMIMLGLVHLTACLPITGWLAIVVQMAAGAVSWGAMSLVWWRIQKKDFLPKRRKAS